jgi:hypothetical protein
VQREGERKRYLNYTAIEASALLSATPEEERVRLAVAIACRVRRVIWRISGFSGFRTIGSVSRVSRISRISRASRSSWVITLLRAAMGAVEKSEAACVGV